MSASLLDQNDFVRIIYNALIVFQTKKNGLPPDTLALADAANCSLSSLGLDQDAQLFHQQICSFWALKDDILLTPRQTLADYARLLLASWRKGAKQVVFFTSGSTGVPQPHVHSSAMLGQELHAVADLFKSVGRVVVTVPLSHSYGFIFGVLLPKLFVVPVQDIAPLPTLISNALRAGDLLVSFPLLLGKLLLLPPPSVQLLSATAPCPEALFAKMEQMGFARLTEIYGASETGAVGYRLSPGTFRLLPHWQKQGKGHVTRKAAAGDGHNRLLPDHVDWHSDNSFSVLGRRDQAVQVAGINVYPAKIESFIAGHEMVKQCAVRLMRAEEGERLKAYVVLHSGVEAGAARRELGLLFRQQLTPPERPGSMTFGRQLPCSSTGKLADWDI